MRYEKNFNTIQNISKYFTPAYLNVEHIRARLVLPTLYVLHYGSFSVAISVHLFSETGFVPIAQVCRGFFHRISGWLQIREPSEAELVPTGVLGATKNPALRPRAVCRISE